MSNPDQQTLYRESYEHDACGIGAVVSIDGKASHAIVNDALSIVERLEHRAGKDAAGETGDGAALTPNYLRLSQAERERLEREQQNS